MLRERALKVALVLVGLLFLAGIYPVAISFLRPGQSGYEMMMLSLYVTLGVFLLLAVRNPSAHRSLIAFTAWSSFAHGAVMAAQAFQHPDERGELLGAVAGLVVVAIALIVLAPAKPSAAPARTDTAYAKSH
jgi:uncharacterized membrane protein HdeD (DUF308 family)